MFAQWIGPRLENFLVTPMNLDVCFARNIMLTEYKSKEFLNEEFHTIASILFWPYNNPINQFSPVPQK